MTTNITPPPQPRPYAGLDDLRRMMVLNSQIKAVHPLSSIHPGDVNWWIGYIDALRDLTQCYFLWEDAGGDLLAWQVGMPDKLEFDTFTRPDLTGSEFEQSILHWMIDHLTAIGRAAPTKAEPDEDDEKSPRVVRGFAFEDETERIAFFRAQGFTEVPWHVCFSMDIRGELPAPMLPEGFHFLERMTIEQADLRADVHFDAFSPGSKMTGERYRHFMTTAPLYDPELDITTVGPDGRFASFAMGWIDAPNKLSIFEPVGTRHEWHRRGLGRATLHEGLRRLKARGAETALVNTEADDEGNIAFYQNAGFRIINRLLAYEKEI